MNREIKFRARDTKNNKWLDSVPSMEYLLDDGDHSISHHDIDDESSIYIYPKNLLGDTFDSRIVWQQYTGLKDKNGKEIYEGDIVKYARTRVESVEFAKNCFKNHLIELGEEIGEILFIKPSFCLSFDHIRYDDIMPMCLAEHRYEVIGNVFENHELLHIVNNE